MSYPASLYSDSAMTKAFAALGDPNSMLGSSNVETGFKFNVISDADDYFYASACETCSDGNNCPGVRSDEDWLGNAQLLLNPSVTPLLSQLSPLSTIASSTSSLCGSPSVSPFSMAPSLPEIQISTEFELSPQNMSNPGFDFDPCNMTIAPSSLSVSPRPSPFSMSPAISEVHHSPIFDSSGQVLDGLFESEGEVIGPSESTNVNSYSAQCDCGNQDLCGEQTNWDSYQHLTAMSNELNLRNVSPAAQESEHGYMHYDVNDHSLDRSDVRIKEEPASDMAYLLTFAPRRAATATKRRLEALFEEEDNDDDTTLQLSQTARSKKRRRTRTRAHDNDDSDLYEPQSDLKAGTSESKTTSLHTRRINYDHLVLSGHPLTHPSETRKFLLDPADCPSCQYGFIRLPDLVRHIKAYHQLGEGEDKLVCDGCETEFSRSDALTRHKNRGVCKGRKRKRRMRKWEVEAARRAAVQQ